MANDIICEISSENELICEMSSAGEIVVEINAMTYAATPPLMYRNIQFYPSGNLFPILDYASKKLTFPVNGFDLGVRIDGVMYSYLVPAAGMVIDLSVINYAGTSLQGILVNPTTKQWIVVPHTSINTYQSTHIIFGMLRFQTVIQDFVMVSPIPYISKGKLYGVSSPPTQQPEIVENSLDAFVKGIAHRGYSGTHPENTLTAYKEAKRLKYSYAEADVEWTSDGIPVLLHDNTIDRTSNGTGAVNSYTLAQLKTYDFGSWKGAQFTGERIPTFQEFIILCKKLSIHPYIELKGTINPAQATILVNIVRQYGMLKHCTWISFTKQSLVEIKTLLPTARLGFLGALSSAHITSALDLKTGANEVFVFAYTEATVTLALVDEAHTNDMEVETGTVNDSALVHSLVEKGVSMIITDTLNIAEILQN